VALMCDRLELDVWEVIEAAATKPYGFMKFLPGPGLGGHCIPVDPAYLSWKMKTLNFTSRFIEVATEINTQMPDYVMRKISDILNAQRLPVNGAKVLILGLAYKPDVGDLRESPSLDVMELLASKGAELSYHDPYAPVVDYGNLHYKSVELTDGALETSDLVVILTGHSGIDYQRIVSKASRVFDTRNATAAVTEGREKIETL
jgi:UDP-N-acetyl-D-glucosamine dehydrogenase